VTGLREVFGPKKMHRKLKAGSRSAQEWISPPQDPAGRAIAVVLMAAGFRVAHCAVHGEMAVGGCSAD
jgi:hypothetical protein